MPYQHFSARASSPTVDLVVDMGNPVLNSTVNGFLKVGPVGATHAATQEAFKMFAKESVTKGDLERLVKKAGKEGLQWGVVAGVYSGDTSIYLSSLCSDSVLQIVIIHDLFHSFALFVLFLHICSDWTSAKHALLFLSKYWLRKCLQSNLRHGCRFLVFVQVMIVIH